MDDSILDFQIPTNNGAIIKVIGVGGGGGNALNHTFSLGLKVCAWPFRNQYNKP